MVKFYLIVCSSILLFHWVVFVSTSSCSSSETKKISLAFTNLKHKYMNDFKNVLHNMAKEEEKTLDATFDEFTSRMARLLFHRIIFVSRPSNQANETLKAVINLKNELKKNTRNELKNMVIREDEKKLDTIANQIDLKLDAKVGTLRYQKIRYLGLELCRALIASETMRARQFAKLYVELDEYINQKACSDWSDQFVWRAICAQEGFLTESEWTKAKQEKKGKKHAITDIPAPRMTTMKGVNRLLAKWLKKFRYCVPFHVLPNPRCSLNCPAYFDSWYRDFNASINDGLKCDSELLHKFLPAELVNEVRRIVQQYYFFYHDDGNNQTKITQQNTVLETRQQIYKVMLQSEFFFKIFLQFRRNFFLNGGKPVNGFCILLPKPKNEKIK
ncbi:uncharacterized protein LOC135845316 [Planococcus citri]|uniref:uncharacterized protein LOC135845316 n=1 Tax=Planococcus citri TaxID=170843 RepID=UPI0031F77523